MKTFIRYIGLLILTLIMAACGSSGGGGGGGASTSGSSGTSTVSIDAGLVSSAAAAGPSASGLEIPLEVNSISFSVTFGDGADEQRCVGVLNPDNSRKASIVETFTGANGTWNISVTAYASSDCTGTVLYTGSRSESISGSTTITVQMNPEIPPVNPCDLYVDANTGWDTTEGPSNTCKSSNDPCGTITHALTQTSGHETICVAAGLYDEENGKNTERFPLYLKDGTTILCQGPNHTSVIDPFVGPLTAVFRATFGVEVGTTNASIIGCKIIVDEDYEVGIDDYDGERSAIITLDNVHVKGDGVKRNTIGVSLRSNSTINNSELTCSALDLSIGNVSEGPTTITVDARNNAWDVSPPDISDVQQDCPFDGTDICEFRINNGSAINLDVSGSSQAADGCQKVCIPTGPDDNCNGIDEDCSGVADDGYQGDITSCGTGECATTGHLVCQNKEVVDNCVPLLAGSEGLSFEGTCSDTLDNDCDGLTDGADGDCIETCTDNDGDGYGNPGRAVCEFPETDCNDDNPAVNPGATEVCNGIDDNCDGTIDEGFDFDQDGFTSCGGDCNDEDAAVNPGATEVCNGIDDNCEGLIDEGYDLDADLFTTCGPDGIPGNADDDCNDGNAAINPNAFDDNCNGIDDNCSGTADEGYVGFAQDCGTGECVFAGTTECRPGGVEVCVPLDLPLTSPAPGATMVDPSFQAVCNQSFNWEGCASALSGYPETNRYELEIVNPDNVLNPIVHATSTPSYAHSTSTPAFTPTGILTDWTWRVRVVINSILGDWSPTRTFNVGDCPPN